MIARALLVSILLSSLLVAEEVAEQEERKRKQIPINFPGFALNSLSVRAFNEVYSRHVAASGSERLLHYPEFMFPLDGIRDWNRIYGKRGFHQFQCVVPFEDGHSALRKILHVTAISGHGSFLAVLKTMGPQGLGYLSFARPGYTLALDFPNAPGARQIITRLERITCDHGGRIYLAKDSTMSATNVRRMYPEYDKFQAVLAEIDPNGRMQSDLARRLDLGVRRS